MSLYRWADCIIDSEIVLPELAAGQPGLTPEVTVTLGTITERETGWPSHWRDPLCYCLSTAIGAFRVENGNAITIDPVEPRDEDGLRLFLFGSAFAALAVQRSQFVLHASAVVTEAGVVAFSAESGEGKSTLAAHLESEGFTLYADDTLPLEIRKAQLPRALPAVRRSKLLPDTMAALGLDAASFPPIMQGQSKRSVLRQDDYAFEAKLPLTGLYILARGEPDLPPQIEPISGLAAFQAIRQQAFRPHYAIQSGRQAAQIEACMAIAAAVPVYRLRRPWALSQIGGTIAALRQHWRLPATGTLHVSH